MPDMMDALLTPDDMTALATRRVRLRLLVLLRWLAVAGQTATILVVWFGLQYRFDLGLCLAVVSASAWVNIFLSFAYPGQKVLSDAEAGAQLTYDVIQLSVLLALTGGIQNPFIALYVAPVIIAISALRPMAACVVIVTASLGLITLVFLHAPLPAPTDRPLLIPDAYLYGLGASVLATAAFTGMYIARVAAEARRMSTGFTMAQTVLAREQRLSALGGLAAAAAHELGTPLGTIQITAKEMVRELERENNPDNALLLEDTRLLLSQAQRCRDILGQLSAHSDQGDVMHASLSLRQLVEEIIQPLKGLGKDIRVEREAPLDAPDDHSPLLRRQPEAIYAISSFVENALDYAHKTITVTYGWNEVVVYVDVRDDGPGFSASVLNKLGEPYISTRSDKQDENHGGLGLGFFIAKTLIERTRGLVEFGNSEEGGAVVRASWPRDVLEARNEGDRMSQA